MNNRSRYLSIPLNKKGIEELEYGSINTENVKVIELSDSEFQDMYKSGSIFDKINEQCALLIDDYESETISNEKVDKCLNIVGDDFDKLREALELAKEYNTFVDLDF